MQEQVIRDRLDNMQADMWLKSHSKTWIKKNAKGLDKFKTFEHIPQKKKKNKKNKKSS